jgi:hypothetical protein
LKRAGRTSLADHLVGIRRGAAINIWTRESTDIRCRSRSRHLLRRGKSLHREGEMSWYRNNSTFEQRIHNYLMRDKGRLGTRT